jgi:hypothetical protein
MPSRARVEELITAVCTGNHADAIARFYTESATMQENAADPRVGRDGLVARERKVLEQVASVVTHRPDFVAIDGDRVAIHWIFDFAMPDGRTRRVDEIAIQEWDGELIARERFVYDSPACTWRAAT